MRDPPGVDVVSAAKDDGITIRIATVLTVNPVLGSELIVVTPIVLIVSHQSEA
jgi:hypothetical protein